MIYKLRRKFIKICVLSFLAVFVVLFAAILLLTTLQTNNSLDKLADVVSFNDGTFPNWSEFDNDFDRPPMPEGLDIESPFTTRFFSVKFDDSGNIISVNVDSISGVSQEEAAEYATKSINSPKNRGWVDDYRYKLYHTETGQAVVFINGANVKQINRQFMFSACTVFVASSLVIIVLVILISGKAVKPVAESYEKQKQFITDANHELKTPLTLISTNLDIMETEIGENEWLSDIREESEMMTELVNRLVSLARMDEDNTELTKESFSLSDAVLEMLSAFVPHIEAQKKKLLINVPEHILYSGNEAAIRQLISILMDNAVKYCDDNGTIGVALYGGKHPILTIDNSYKAVENIELNKLFDRFYRADKARTYGSGFGIGLSIAKAVVEKHHGEIRAINIENHSIRFQVNM